MTNLVSRWGAVWVGSLVLGTVSAIAGTVTLDGSYGASGALSGPNYQITAAMGRQMGSNLFQSFGLFSLSNGDSATFSGPAEIHNVLARVTGGNASSIDGSLDCSIAGANLFLINPAGLMFGAHAQVNVTGSFAVTTANYAKLSDGGVFYAQFGGNDQLTSAPISAFGFLSATPRPISFSGTRLTMHSGQGLHIIAGNITLDQGSADGVTQRGTSLMAPSGNLTLFSAASVGEVPFSLASGGSGYGSATNTSFGNITIEHGSTAAIDGQGGGSIVIRGGKLVVDHSRISSANSGSVAGGEISAQVDSLVIQEAGVIIASTTSAGQAGNVSATANSVSVNGGGSSSLTGIFSDAYADSGNAGTVNVTVKNDLQINDGGEFSAGTFSAGKGGDVKVQASDLTIIGGAGVFTGIESNSNVGASGNGGDVEINVNGQVTIKEQGEIACTTFSSGNAGQVTVTAGSLTIDGAHAEDLTGIVSNSNAGATGNGGDVTVAVSGLIDLNREGEIASNTFSAGNAGQITVDAGSLMIASDMGQETAVTGIVSDSLSSNHDSHGNAGSIRVTVDGFLEILAGGEIATNTFSDGNAGEVTVDTASLTINGAANVEAFTGISSETGGRSSNTGNGGDVVIDVAGQAMMTGSAQIDASTLTSGHGGDIDLNAGSLTIDGTKTPIYTTGITADANGSGNAGDVTVNISQALIMLGASQIATDTFSSANGGEVKVYAGSLLIDGSRAPEDFSGISSESDSSDASSTGNAGSVLVQVSGALTILGDGVIDTDTFSRGSAGNVTVSASSLDIDGSATPNDFTGISCDAGGYDNNASDVTGNGGNLSVTVHDMTITGSGEISSSSFTTGHGGDVNVAADSIVIDGSSVPDFQTGITAIAHGYGNAGSLTVSAAQTLSIVGSGAISAITQSKGNAGEVVVKAGTLYIDGSSTPDQVTGIFANSLGDGDEDDPSGNAGDVTVVVSQGAFIGLGGRIAARSFTNGNAGDLSVTVGGLLDITAGGEVVASTEDTGNAGNLQVTAGSITINGTDDPDDPTGIASASDYGATGNGGNVTVSVRGFLDIIGGAGPTSILTGVGGGITASSEGPGTGGHVNVWAGSVALDSDGTINAQTTGGGAAGDVTIHAGMIELNSGSSIATSASNANAGTIEIDTGSELSLSGGSSITSSAGANGGNILLHVGTLLYLQDGEITSAAGGNGGNITIDPKFVVLNDSLISADAAVGQGGKILIFSDYYFNSNSLLTATGGTQNGSVTISAPELNLAGSLLLLPSELVNQDKRLRESCVRSINHEYSSVTVVGRGGTESSPQELQSDFGVSGPNSSSMGSP